MSWTCLWKAWWRHSCPVHSRRTKPCKSKTWAEKQACTTGASKIEWCLVLCARPYNNEAALEGVTSLEVAPPGEYLSHLPCTPESLVFGPQHNASLDHVTLTSIAAWMVWPCQAASKAWLLVLRQPQPRASALAKQSPETCFWHWVWIQPRRGASSLSRCPPKFDMWCWI